MAQIGPVPSPKSTHRFKSGYPQQSVFAEQAARSPAQLVAQSEAGAHAEPTPASGAQHPLTQSLLKEQSGVHVRRELPRFVQTELEG